MLAHTPAPWTAEQLSRSTTHIMGAPDSQGDRHVVCIVDGSGLMPGNVALIVTAPMVADAIRRDDVAAARAALDAAGVL